MPFAVLLAGRGAGNQAANAISDAESKTTEVVSTAADAAEAAQAAQAATDEQLLALARNNPPVFFAPAQGLSALIDQTTVVDMARLFIDNDPDDSLTFIARVNTPDLFEIVGQQGTVLTLRGKVAGSGSIAIFATDRLGKSNSASIRVDVTPPS